MAPPASNKPVLTKHWLAPQRQQEQGQPGCHRHLTSQGGKQRGCAPSQALGEPRWAGSPWHSLFSGSDGRHRANASRGPAAKCCPGPGSLRWGLLQGGPAAPAGTRAAAGSAWDRLRTGPWWSRHYCGMGGCLHPQCSAAGQTPSA